LLIEATIKVKSPEIDGIFFKHSGHGYRDCAVVPSMVHLARPRARIGGRIHIPEPLAQVL